MLEATQRQNVAAPAGLPHAAPTPASVVPRIVTDILSLLLAFVITKQLRYVLGGLVFGGIEPQRLHLITPPIWLLIALWLLSAWWIRLYRPRSAAGPFESAIQIVEAMGLVCALTVLASFALYEHTNYLSRAIVALLFFVGIACSIVLRSLLWFATTLIRARTRPESLLIVGQGPHTSRLFDRLMPSHGRQIMLSGLLTPKDGPIAARFPVPVLGRPTDLRYAINHTKAARVIAVDAEVSLEDLAHCVEVCSAMQVPLNCTGESLTRFPIAADLIQVAGVRLINIHHRKRGPVKDIAKRSIDVLASMVLLVAALPVFLLLAIAIKWTSAGPVLFVSDRVGLGGRHFKFLKFRTMVSEAQTLRQTLLPHNSQGGHLFKVRNDPRVTKVGRFMRRFSLDELPQLWNVVRGDMSLVGPRPLPAIDLEADGLSSSYREWSIARSSLRPGVTGLWQVRGRSQLPFEEMVRLDLLYVQTCSNLLDLRIVLETIPAVLFGRGAI
jgi:exopolysaccharide biosynthesis polyprenyl glycosylphosphotransferase